LAIFSTVASCKLPFGSPNLKMFFFCLLINQSKFGDRLRMETHEVRSDIHASGAKEPPHLPENPIQRHLFSQIS
jgi:hypothetical protein